MAITTVLRGGGDLASGVALRLHRAGLRLVITEIPQPLAVRRAVSFAEAVYQGEFVVEGVTARRVDSLGEALRVIEQGFLPVLVDPRCQALFDLQKLISSRPATILIDARMLKRSPDIGMESADLVIGLGPGFIAGTHCHAVIETRRGHTLGRVIWQGSAEMDTGIPEGVAGRGSERVLRAPRDGLLSSKAEIGDHLEEGEVIAEVDGASIRAPFTGVLRGLLRPGLEVQHGMKIGDLDPRDDKQDCFLVSDKALAVGGGVLEAILSCPDLRPYLWDEVLTQK